ncbi:hypothetical protein WH5701_04120 [Synechococcus sp. WH 5701]|nr:hypothetical protein WH5701_04120 [Synechococcus sp. WH 5701]
MAAAAIRAEVFATHCFAETFG